MGTYFTSGATKESIIAEILGGLDKPHRVIREKGETVLWTVEGGEDKGKPVRLIGCYLLKPDRYGWGYKPMSEDMGPYFWSCPLEFLDVVTEPVNETSRIWREKVRKHHASA